MSFKTTEFVLASAVADAGTVTAAYPAGTAQADFTGANAAPNTGSVVINGNEVYKELGSGVRVNFTYGGSNITITNNTGQTWPAGSSVVAQFGQFGADSPWSDRAATIGLLTDSSGGTAGATIAAIGGTFDQDEVRNAVASLAAKVNEITRVLKTSGITK